MSVKARWSRVDLTIDDDGDPFADDAPREVHIPTVGLPIDVNASEGSLAGRLKNTVRVENDLAQLGAFCELKGMPDTTCFACPLYEGDGDTPQAHLCRLGREQDTLITLLAVRKHGEGR